MPTGSPDRWPWLPALLVAALAGGAWWLHGRKPKPASDEWDDAEWLTADAAEPEPAPDPTAVPEQPSPPPLPRSETPVRPAFGREVLALALDPMRMSATLTSTSLSYRLTVTNKGARTIGPVAVAGSMVSAHASLPADHQLGTDGQLLEVLHEIAALAPGESVVVKGDLRLPLPEITPIRSGNALLFVPLARFRAEAEGASAISAFAIGETPASPAAALVPFRIDMGPRIWNKVSRHQLELAPA